MKRAPWVLMLLMTAAGALGGDIDGSVFIRRDIGPDFTSSARADFMNDLGLRANAELSLRAPAARSRRISPTPKWSASSSPLLPPMN